MSHGGTEDAAMSADHMQKLQEVQKTLYDAAPFPGRLPRRITDKENREWELDAAAAKIPKGQIVMIIGTKKP
jgi:hypothetical protein